MLASFLESYFKDKDLKRIFKDVTDTDNADVIQPIINQAIEQYLQSSIERIIFIQSSIGVVFGLLLTTGSKVVLKVYSPKLSKSYLQEINRILVILQQENFPSPKVLSPIFAFNKTYAGCYELIEGKVEDAHQPMIREELAKYLAKFSILAEKHDFQPVENFFQQAAYGKLWPIPHNALFNIKASSKGAGWIAKKAALAKKTLAAYGGKKTLSHTDWGTKNAVFRNKQLIGIFDWDSLGSMTELEMVGRAAAQFTADWESGFKITPSPEEGRLFVNAYQNYRNIKFTEDEYKIISASADYLITIIARFEHAGKNPLASPYQDLSKACGQSSFLFA